MSQHARIEELSDSDSDPPEDDLSTYTSTAAPQVPSFRHRPSQPQHPPSQQQKPFNPQPPPDYKTYSCLYPLYFDASRTRSEGRRVGQEQAVKNPLAREIVEAVQELGLKTVFEPGKTHPRDWANPGRVRVGLTEGRSARVKNKHHLYTLVSAHLKAHPANPSTPLKLRIHGMPMPESPLPPPAVPKGYKINAILPLHSPAVSGGGVSENILRDMMAEMQGGGGGQGGMAGMVEQGGGSGNAGAAQGKRKREGGKKK